MKALALALILAAPLFALSDVQKRPDSPPKCTGECGFGYGICNDGCTATCRGCGFCMANVPKPPSK